MGLHAQHTMLAALCRVGRGLIKYDNRAED